jgi:hypothetical protein
MFNSQTLKIMAIKDMISVMELLTYLTVYLVPGCLIYIIKYMGILYLFSCVEAGENTSTAALPVVEGEVKGTWCLEI